MRITLSRSSIRPGLRFSGFISNVLIHGGKAGRTGWGIAGLLRDQVHGQDLWWQYSGSYKTSTVNYMGIYERNGVMGYSLLVRLKPGLGEIMLEVLNASKCHDTLTPCSTPAEGFLRFIERVQIWVEGDLPLPLVTPRKRIGFVLSTGRRVHVH